MGILDIFENATEAPQIDRVRHVPRLRTLRVARSERVTPAMLRLTLSGADLADFRSDSFDDHLKVFLPEGGARRDYTPRWFDAAAGTLAIDFALHGGGAVSGWALAARPGDRVDISGPKSSTIVSPDIGRWLLVGDETALPAIGRCIEEARHGVEITSVVAVADPGERQLWETRAVHTPHWVYRPLQAAADPMALLEALRAVDLRPDTFVWVAAEASVARAVRDHLVDDRGHPRNWIKAGGYWVEGRAGGKERLG